MLAICSDIHGNLSALEAVLADMRVCGVGRVYCLGDTVGYGPQPVECVERVRAEGFVHVLGNHEEGLVSLEAKGWFNEQSLEALERTGELVDMASVEWMRGLPTSVTGRDVVGGLRCVHGMVPDSVRVYLFELDAAQVGTVLGAVQERVSCVGHTHELGWWTWSAGDGEAVERTLPEDGSWVELGEADRHLLNVGSVGQPRDGDWRAKYVVYDVARDAVSVCRVAYDVDATVALMRERGMPQRYAERLVRFKD